MNSVREVQGRENMGFYTRRRAESVCGKVLEKRHRLGLSVFEVATTLWREPALEHFPGVFVVVQRAEANAMSPVERIFGR